jgi:arylsulfatase A-like enzyme
MSRSTNWSVVLWLLGVSLVCGQPTGENVPRPNVIFVLADDLGWSDLGCYGADLHETPRLDRFAAAGVRFTDAYAAAPVCSPTRAALMTGKYPARLRITIWYEGSQQPPNPRRKLLTPQTVGNLPHTEVTLAEVLREAGYYTAHIGKWHLGDAAHYPETHGFDFNLGGTFWGAPSTFFYPYRGFWSRSTEYRYVPGLEFGREGEYLTDRLTDEAIAVLQRVQDRPFFLYLAYHTVHTPIEGKADVVRKFRGRLGSAEHHDNEEYAAMVYSLDENMGRLLDALNALGLADSTLVIFTSDNGGYVNNYRDRQVTDNFPLRSGKGSLYEGGVRVPLLVRWPGVTPPHRECSEPVVTADFYLTILEALRLAGDAEHNAMVDGVSLLPLLRDPKGKLARETLYFHYPHYYATTTPVSALRQGNWKLLEYFEDEHVELYNLAEDLGEQIDLAATMPVKAAALRKQLHAWRDEVAAQVPARSANR